MTSTFDTTAPSFERYRAFPSGVPEAIRKAIWESTGAPPSVSVLDLGAGSGRIGRAFVEAGDSYVGVDLSLSMLNEFRARNPGACLLHADAERLPFPDGSFEIVLLLQILNGAHDWRSLLCEAVRVTDSGGSVVVGHVVTPSSGVDALMKGQLALILEEMGAPVHGSNESRQLPLEWLRMTCSRSTQATAATWTVQRTARAFLERHRSGASFSTLPATVHMEALRQLTIWADKKLGSLDRVFSEQHSSELHVFRFGEPEQMETGNPESDRAA